MYDQYLSSQKESLQMFAVFLSFLEILFLLF